MMANKVRTLEFLLEFAASNVPFHKKRAPALYHTLENWPLMSKDDLVAHSIDTSTDLLSDLTKTCGGSIIASGGTTSRPKYIFYAHSEMAIVAQNIAKHFMVNGMAIGDKVINYFTSGDMWASFLLADKILSMLPVTSFSLGYSPKMQGTVDIIERFKPNVIIGIPSMIIDLAQYCAEYAKPVRIQKVFYGGEAMTTKAQELLVSIWGCEIIRSASYASTDVGAIGWQCPHCKAGEHYPFDDVIVEILNSEIVVTSLSRRAMPMIRYRTGDKGEWCAAACDCANGVPIFKLLTRLDNVILIWGLRILYDQIVSVFDELCFDYAAIQALAYDKDYSQYLVIKVDCDRHLDGSTQNLLRDLMYDRCEDIKDMQTREMLDAYLLFEQVPIGDMQKNERTGKVMPIIDSRILS